MRTALSESLAVAEAYLQEHQQVIRADVLAMASDLNRESYLLTVNPQRLAEVVNGQAMLRSLNEAVVFDTSGRILARSGLTFSLEFGAIPEWAIRQAEAGDVAIVTGDNEDRVRALVRLDQFPGAFLYVGRFVEPQVLAHMKQTQGAVAQYERLEGQRSDFQITVRADLPGRRPAASCSPRSGSGSISRRRWSQPIGGLIEAAERVRAGDLAARVRGGRRGRGVRLAEPRLQPHDEPAAEPAERADRGQPASSTSVAASPRRCWPAFRPASSASTSMAASTCRTARPRCCLPPSSIIASARISPRSCRKWPSSSMRSRRRPDRLAQAQIQITRRGRVHVLLVRIAAEQEGGEVKGYVVTFDEVTELLSAQRKAAWADVARRIAHEIKNPLTPIQLSAERLRRKYLREIHSDPETFSICTDTIIRHVDDIGRMVDEFSSFARMPAPVMKNENLLEICRQALFLQRNAHTDIDFEMVAPEMPPVVACDARLIGQALTNLLKNAAESIQGRAGSETELPRGHIVIRVQADEGAERSLAVEDNGKGLPEQERGEPRPSPMSRRGPRAPGSGSPSSRRSWKSIAAS